MPSTPPKGVKYRRTDRTMSRRVRNRKHMSIITMAQGKPNEIMGRHSKTLFKEA